MKSTGYIVLDAAILKIEHNHNYTVVFTDEELKKLIGDKGDLFDNIRYISQELISFQIKLEDEYPPVINLVKSCSYDDNLQIIFDEKAIRLLIESIK